MAVRVPRRFTRGIDRPDALNWELQIDAREAERRKQERIARLNTFVVPRLRAFGLALNAVAVLLHNHFILGELSWASWLGLTGILAGYSAATWVLLQLFYADLRGRVDLGLVFLACDLPVFALIVYASGAERSWLFFLPVFRVIDQTLLTFRRTLVFAHLAPLTYLGVIGYAIWIDGRSVPLAPELAKALFLYLGSLYIVFIARTAEGRFRRTAEVIRFARQLVVELGRKSEALEISSKDLLASLERQGRLAGANAELLRRAERETLRQQQIFNSTSDGIVLVDHDLSIVAANVRAGDLLGFDPASVSGLDGARVLSRLYPVGDSRVFVARLQALLSEPWAANQGELQQPASGRLLHWVAQPTPDGAGGSAGLTLTFQDVTQQRHLMRQLEDKSRLLEEASRRSEEANRAKGRFLSNVSRELRTPLEAIAGMSAQMDQAGPKPALVRRIGAAAQSLLAIVRDIDDFSRIESHRLTLLKAPFALRALLREAIGAIGGAAAAKALALDLEVAGDVPDNIVGDRERLRQVLLNLLANAVRFTEHGGIRLRVDVASMLPTEVCLHFAVIDTGPGVPGERQETLFEAFHDRDEPGISEGETGFELSIAARLIRLMLGDVWVESEAGKGAAFRFTARFDVQMESPPSPGSGQAASQPAVSGSRGAR